MDLCMLSTANIAIYSCIHIRWLQLMPRCEKTALLLLTRLQPAKRCRMSIDKQMKILFDHSLLECKLLQLKNYLFVIFFDWKWHRNILSQPPYSPDWFSWEYFIFPRSQDWGGQNLRRWNLHHWKSVMAAKVSLPSNRENWTILNSRLIVAGRGCTCFFHWTATDLLASCYKVNWN